MSGGSFNYLYMRCLDVDVSRLEEMAAILREQGHIDAAREVGGMAKLLLEAEAKRLELQDVLRAVEWFKSGDYGSDSLTKYVLEWAGIEASLRGD
jgi:hypothetical protein